MASDSISARPMIIAVWMRAAAPGCRPMASTAAATALPCPRPHSPAAIAMPMPAAMTVNGPTQPPVAAPGACASATPGNARTNRLANLSERRTTVLLCTCAVLVMAGIVVLGAVTAVTVLGVLDGPRDVEHREHHEDEGLKERDQQLERIEEAHGEGDGDQTADAAHHRARRAAGQRPADQAVEAHEEENDRQQDVTAHHVAEQPQRQRQRPREMADDLDRHHQRREPHHRAHEVLDVGDRALL